MNTSPKIDYRVLIAVVMALAAIEICALFNDINGTLMTLVIGALAAIGGVAIPKEKFIKKD